MRNVWYSILGLTIVAFLPAVAADDPSYTVPNPQPVLDAVGAGAADTRADVEGFNTSTQANAGDAAASVAALTLPASVIMDQLGDAGDLAGGVAARAAGLAGVAVGFANATANAKIDEVAATQAAVDDIGSAAAGTAGVIVNAAQDAVCNSPVLSGGAPNSCADGSIVAAVVEALLGTQSNVSGQSLDMNDTLAAVLVFIGDVVGS